MKNKSIFTGILAVSLGSTLALGQALTGTKLGQEDRRQGRSIEQRQGNDNEKTESQETREKLRGGGDQGSPQGKRPKIERCGDKVKGTLKSIMEQLDLTEDQKEAFIKAHREFAAEKKEIAERKGTTEEQKRAKYEAMQEQIKEHRKRIDSILNDEQKAKLRELFEKAGKCQRDEDGNQGQKQERPGHQREKREQGEGDKKREGGQEQGKKREGGQEQGKKQKPREDDPAVVDLRKELKELHEAMNLTKDQKAALHKNREAWHKTAYSIHKNKDISEEDKKKKLRAAWTAFASARAQLLTKDQLEIVKKMHAAIREFHQQRKERLAQKEDGEPVSTQDRR